MTYKGYIAEAKLFTMITEILSLNNMLLIVEWNNYE